MLELVKKYLPERFGRLTDKSQFEGGFLTDFAAARNAAHDAAKNDLILWLDSDDTLFGAEDLREAAAQHFAKHRDPIFLLYDYSFDPDGALNTVLWRERIYSKSAYVWRGICHECCVPRSGQVGRNNLRLDPSQVKVIHKAHQSTDFSDIRNYVILRNAVEEAHTGGGWVDPRWYFYLGNSCRGLERQREARHWFAVTLEKSGSREDRYSCAINIGMTYQLEGRHWRSLDWYFQASKISPKDPRSYFSLARAYHDLGYHEQCLFWTQVGRQWPAPDLLTAYDPQQFDLTPSVYEVLSLKELGQYEAAEAVLERVLAKRPNFEVLQELSKMLRGEQHNSKLKESLLVALGCSASEGDAIKMMTHLKPEVRKHFPELQVETRPPRHARKTITYLCPPTVEPWDATSGNDGIGGSEKMVLQLSREWAKLGWDVEVYGMPKPENRYKKIDGVVWKPWECFNPHFPRDILIAWRHNGLLDLDLRAKAIFVDLHDVQQIADYAPPRQEKVAGYFFKSQFHAEHVAKAIEPGKVIITRNGIDLEQFDKAEAAERDPTKIVFLSSADRGLLGAIRIFQRAAAAHKAPLSLHVFYGFTPLYFSRARQIEYQHFWDEGADRHMLDYSEQCLMEMERDPRIVPHGRVSYEDVARHLKTAGILIYPTGFPEISCMGAMEAQIAGCLPLVSPTGALPETVQYGNLCKTPDEFVTAIHQIIDKGHTVDDYRAKMSDWARQAFDIRPLAREWADEFEKHLSKEVQCKRTPDTEVAYLESPTPGAPEAEVDNAKTEEKETSRPRISGRETPQTVRGRPVRRDSKGDEPPSARGRQKA